MARALRPALVALLALLAALQPAEGAITCGLGQKKVGTTCQSCSAGTYNNIAGTTSSSCFNCATPGAGQYTSSVCTTQRNTIISDALYASCQRGEYQVEAYAPGTALRLGNDGRCAICGVDQVSDGTTTDCVYCPTGSHLNDDATAAWRHAWPEYCIVAPGYYSFYTGDWTTYVSAHGVNMCDAGYTCPGNMALNAYNSNQMSFPCPANSFSAPGTASDCIACPDGTDVINGGAWDTSSQRMPCALRAGFYYDTTSPGTAVEDYSVEMTDDGNERLKPTAEMFAPQACPDGYWCSGGSTVTDDNYGNWVGANQCSTPSPTQFIARACTSTTDAVMADCPAGAV